ncbi:MAG: FtsW/RodA/SpoVE family cell cycle protein [Acidimicrobiales bacterium]
MAASATTASRSHPRRRSELGLILVGIVVVFFADIVAYLGTYNKFPPQLGEFLLILLGMGLIGNLANRFLVPEADPVILPIVLVLNGLSYVMMQRLEPYNPDSPHLAGYQAIWSVAGLAVYILTLIVFRRSRELERYRYLLAASAFILLILPLVPGLRDSSEIANAHVYLWVKLGPITFQPIELAKLFLVIFFASYFTEKRELLSMATNRVGNRLVPDLRGFGPIVVAWMASIGVIILERDIGFSLILFVLFITMLWVTTGRWIYIVLGLIAFAIGTFIAAHILSQLNIRIEIWLDPWKYLTGPQLGLQPAIGEVMMGRGGLTGTGLGLGGAPAIPVNYSDFIFAAIGNELGLAGTTAILVAFMLLVGSGMRIATRARSEFAKLTALGLTVVIGFQAFVIMAGVTRLLPLTGVTLPFVSYGGSSLVANYMLVAMLMRISNEAADPVRTAPPNVIAPARVPQATGVSGDAGGGP